MIPEQLHSYSRFIKLKPESKAPKVSPEGPFYSVDDPELENWIQNGGNVGLNLGELVALDVDSDRFGRIAKANLPRTFSVKTGSGGEHRYYRSGWSGKRQFKDGETDLGSVRSGNWYTVVPPSVHDETGNEYTVLHDRRICPVPKIQIQDFLTEVSEEMNSQHSGGGGGGAAGCVGSSSVPQIPSEYPNQSAQWSTLQSWLSANGLLEALNQTVSSDWSGLEFKICKCLAEGGFSEASISDALDRLHHNSKWHSRGSDYKTRTVRNAITAAVNDPYVDFSETGDMTGNTVESRKTDSGGTSPRKDGGEFDMVDFNEKESVLAKESNDEGSTAVKAVKVEGHDGSDSFEFVSLRKGNLRERETADGDRALVVDIDDTNGKSVGSPDDLDVVIDSLEQLQEELE
jgi:hypothetical protein